MKKGIISFQNIKVFLISIDETFAMLHKSMVISSTFKIMMFYNTLKKESLVL